MAATCVSVCMRLFMWVCVCEMWVCVCEKDSNQSEQHCQHS